MFSDESIAAPRLSSTYTHKRITTARTSVPGCNVCRAEVRKESLFLPRTHQQIEKKGGLSRRLVAQEENYHQQCLSDWQTSERHTPKTISVSPSNVHTSKRLWPSPFQKVVQPPFDLLNYMLSLFVSFQSCLERTN